MSKILMVRAPAIGYMASHTNLSVPMGFLAANRHVQSEISIPSWGLYLPTVSLRSTAVLEFGSLRRMEIMVIEGGVCDVSWRGINTLDKEV